jgi:FkbM family methyltransferase
VDKQGIRVHNFRGITLKSNYSNSVFEYLSEEIFSQQVYYFQTENKQPIIVDVGANIGLSSLYFKKLYPFCKIVAIEPDPDNFKLLTANLCDEDVTLIQVAASNFKGKMPFYTNADIDYTLPVTSLYKNEFSNKEIEVEVIDFAEMISSFEEIDLCKIDVEGEESNIIDSLLKDQYLTKIKEYIIEYHSWIDQRFTLPQMLEIFELNNFDCKVIKEEDKDKEWSVSETTILNFKRRESCQT